MKGFISAFVILILVCTQLVLGQIPKTISYQGILTDASGTIVPDGNYDLTFKLYTSAVGGSPIWTESHPAVAVSKGVFNVILGSTNPLNLAFDVKYWLGITVGAGSELTPRIELTSSPYSLNSLGGGGGGWTDDGTVVRLTTSTDNVGIGTNSPANKVEVVGGIDLADYVRHRLDVNTYLGFPANDQISLFTNGVNRLTVLPNGNVGIGTSSPAQTLQVAGMAQVEGFKMTPGAGAGKVLTCDASGVGTWQTAPGGIGGGGTTNYLPKFTGPTTLGNSVIYQNGSDIGIGTTSPAAKLYVNGTLTANGLTTILGTDAELSLNSSSGSSPRITLKEAGTPMWTIRGNVGDDRLYFEPATPPVTPASFSLSQDAGISHVYEGSLNGLHASGSTVFAMYYIENNKDGDGYGLSAGMKNIAASNYSYGVYGFNYGTGYGVYGRSYNADGIGTYGINLSAGHFGFAGGPDHGLYGENANGNYGYIGGPGYGVYGDHAGGNYGYIGGGNYGVFANLITTNVGDYAIYGYGTDDVGEDGTGYGVYQTLGGVRGYNFYGNPYTFGVAGYSYLDYNRSGGLIGAKYNATSWGSLAYQNSSGTEYGGYFTSYTTGTGENAGSSGPAIGIGMGAWGELFGADIHGQVYGAFVEGKNYALYTNGKTIKNDLDVHLQETPSNSLAVLYTNVSTDVTVQTSGFGQLSGGRCTIEFDEHFKQAVSKEIPVVVTVTPLGSSNGLYISETRSDGFTVLENNNGKSNVTFSFIAIGRRAGYENPQLPQEVLAADYLDKISRGLHNDVDVTTDGEGLYYENGQLMVGAHPLTQPESGKIEPPVEPRSKRVEIPRKSTDDKNGAEVR
ncbi:MAG: hypothetical protein Kow0042_09370 [Calditrichia bacterium]